MTHEEIEGVAALDALGAATRGEVGVLRFHLAGCRPCRRVRAEMTEAAALMALGLEPVAPPPGARRRVMAAVSGEERRNMAWWLAAAAALFMGLWCWREVALRGSLAREATQQAQIERLREDNQALSRRSETLSSQIAALTSPSTLTIRLAGQEIAPAASANVFLQPDRRRALVFFHDLPANPGDKSYQLWIIPADKPAPISAGVFDVSTTGSASIVIENLPLATEIKALAVTLEPRGGVTQPTNTRFYVAGNASL